VTRLLGNPGSVCLKQVWAIGHKATGENLKYCR